MPAALRLKSQARPTVTYVFDPRRPVRPPDPSHWPGRFGAHPGELALGQLARRGHRPAPGLRQDTSPGQVRPQLAIAYRAHRRADPASGRRAVAQRLTSSRNPSPSWRRSAVQSLVQHRLRRARASNSAGASRPAGSRSHAAAARSACRRCKHTSRARWMRWRSSGRMRAAAAGSSRASSACSAGQPSARRAHRARAAARRTACGSAARPCSSARRYSMVPPTSSGTRPRA